ncbi:MAG: aminoglycoside phosphotransferase family protein [Verrucomicrobiales bacterium]|nr:aminoglycoside phosphotransferase family protein [Verrucomicrobiales bacterium]
MNSEERDKLTRIGRVFRIPGTFHDGHRIKIGHINETFAATYDDGGRPFRVVHQTINTHVFREPVGLMNNVVRVTGHLRGKLEAQGLDQLDRRALRVIPTREDQAFHVDEEGRYWRTFVFVDDVRSYDAVESPRQAYQAGFAFGQFQSLLADLPAAELATTIPDFHHTPKRFERLRRAIATDEFRRGSLARREIEFALGMGPLVSALVDAEARGEVPLRVTHNDTKFNNVMLDVRTGEAMCVVDLDTVMPGLVLYDFGDMVRTTTSRTAEDEQFLERVELELPMFEALAKGYLEAARGFLTPAEKRLLVLSGKLITFTIGIRFLTDYLEGDQYFRIHREHHNLDRCRKQFKLIESMNEREAEMQRIVERFA